MEDLRLVAMLFQTSSKLQHAASSLEKIPLENSTITDVERDALSWSGRFLSEMDWGSQIRSDEPITGGLSLRATSVRPTFYSCLFRMAPKLREAGINDERELSSFLTILYRNMQSPDSPGRGHKKLTTDQAMLGAKLLREMADSMLVQINNNGLPKPTTFINDEWEPTTSEFAPVFAI